MELIDISSATQELSHKSTSSTQSNWFHRQWTKMGVATRKIFKPLRNILTSSHKIHLIDDPSVVKDCYTQYNNALKDSSDEDIDRCFMRLTYTLVHSTQVDDVLRGIELLEEGLSKNAETSSKERISEKMYHLALGYYRCEQYNRSVELLKSCVENSPNHKKASTLLKKVEDQIRRDEILCKGCAGFTCFAGLLGTFAATRQSDKKKYEKLSE